MNTEICMSLPIYTGLIVYRRSRANALAVPERQQLSTLRRQQKSERDALASVEDKVQQAERQKAKLSGEVNSLAEREQNVSIRKAIR